MVNRLSAFLFVFLYLDSVQAGTKSIDRCPGTIFRRVEFSYSTVSVTWDDPQCGPNAQSTHEKGFKFGPGVHNVIYWFSGNGLNNANQRCCSFDVFVAGPDFDLCSQNVCDDTDVCVPEVDHYYCYPGNSNIRIYNCSTTVILRTLGANSVTAEFVEPTAFDHYGRQLLPLNVPNVLPGSLLSQNEHINTYFFSDRGTYASCSFSINVEAVFGPGFQNCPQDIHVTSQNSVVRVDWLEPQLQSNEDRNLVALTQTHSPGQFFPVPSSNTVNYTFTDTSNGINTTCSFEVNTESPETIAGEIAVIGSSETFTTIQQNDQNVVNWPRPYLDRSDSNSNIPLIVTPSRVQPDIRSGTTNNQVYPKGFYPVTYNFTDVYGNNLETKTYVVVYYNGVDEVQFECPSSGTPMPVFSELSVTANWTVPDAARGNEANLAWREDPPYQPNQSLFDVGTTSFVYTFYSPGSLLTPFYCPYSVTVTDNIPPQITSCPSDITVEAPSGTSVIVHFMDTANATDGSGMVTKYVIPTSPVTLPAGQFRTVNYYFIDGLNSVADGCSFNITVLIQANVTTPAPPQPAVITNCLDRVLNISGNSTTLSPNLVPQAVDQTSRIQAMLSASSFLVNTRTSVTATFPGLTKSCDFMVLVLDNIPPVVYNCSQEITVSAQKGTNYLPVNWTEPRSVDSFEGGDLVARSHAPGDLFPVGETTDVLYVFEDDTGFQTNCFVNITVKGAPLEQCPTNNNDPEQHSFSFTSETILVIVVTGIATFVFSLGIFMMSLCCCTCCCVVDTENGNKQETTRQGNSNSNNYQRTRLYVRMGSKRVPIYGPVTPLSNNATRPAPEIDNEWSDYDHGDGDDTNNNHTYQNKAPKLNTVHGNVLSNGQSPASRDNRYSEDDFELQSTMKPPHDVSFSNANSGGRAIDNVGDNNIYGNDYTPEANRGPPLRPPKPRNHQMLAGVQQVKEEQAWRGRVVNDGELYGFDNPA